MFDEIRCEAPLPDGFDDTTTWFQTMSFPDPCLLRYTITADENIHFRLASLRWYSPHPAPSP